MRIRLSEIYRCKRKYECTIYMKGGNGSIERQENGNDDSLESRENGKWEYREYNKREWKQALGKKRENLQDV